MAQTRRGESRRQSAKMAFCGLMVGLSAALMLAGGIIPVATYCAPMAAGILLLPVLLEYGKKAAWTAFAATALLSLMLDADKEAAFFYLFLGYYPLVKWTFDRIRSKPLRVGAKLALFTAATALMYAVMGLLLGMDAVVAEFREMGAALFAGFIVLFGVCMLLYDRLITPMAVLYARKLAPRLAFLRR